MVGIEYNALNRVNRSGDTMTGSLTVPYLNVTGDVDIDGNIAVNGSSTISVNETITGNLLINGSVTVSGNNSNFKVHNTQNNNAFIVSGGNIGIGVGSPFTQLHISSSTGENTITIQRADTSVSADNNSIGRIDFYSNDSNLTDSNVVGYMRVSSQGAFTQTNPTGRLELGVSTGAGSVQPFITINSGGQVGINTNTPTAPLHVKSSAVNTTFVKFDSSTSDQMFEVVEKTAGDSLIRQRNVDNTITNVFDTAGNSYINGGNLGLGTTSPNAQLTLSGNDLPLHIHGTGSIDLLFVSGNGAIGMGTDTPTNKLNIMGGTNTHITFEVGSSTSGYTFYNSVDNTGVKIGHNSASRDIEFQTAGSSRLTITNIGRVGIGTVAPSSPF